MNVLFFTRKVDKKDSRVGFAHRWVEALARRVDRLYVLCLETGEVELPPNVELIPLGEGRYRRFIRFNRCMPSIVPKVDAIFCHMNPIYAIISAPYAKMFGKKLYLWYTHGALTGRLKVAHILADKIFTASRGSISLDSAKIVPVGHGIDTDVFKPRKTSHAGLTLLAVSRISPIKRIEELIGGMEELVKRRKDCHLLIAGDVPVEANAGYLEDLKKQVSQTGLEGNVRFLGPVAYEEMPQLYSECDVFVSASATGSLDKTVLEAMSCGVPVVVKNQVYKPLHGPVFFTGENDFPDAVETAIGSDKARLREEIIRDHDVKKLMDKIVKSF